MEVSLDKELFLLLNSLHCETVDAIMWQISGKWMWIPLYAIILYSIVKKYRVQSIYFIVAIVLTILISDQISVLIKNGVERLRPSHNPDFENIIHIVNAYRGGNFGFVSSHAANTFGLAFFTLKLFKKKWITITMLSWAALVSYSRIYLGVHYPGDIIGGALLGISISYILFTLTAFIYQKLEKRQIT